MREELIGREVAISAIHPLLQLVQGDPEGDRLCAGIDPAAERIGWDQFCELLAVAAKSQSPRELGAQSLTASASKYRKRIRVAKGLLTFEDLLRFALYPRNPIDFSCINTSVTARPGRVDVVAYVLRPCEVSTAFWEVALGACDTLVDCLGLPKGTAALSVVGRQAHFTITHEVSRGPLQAIRRFMSSQLLRLYSCAIIYSSYKHLVVGRKMFELQLAERAEIEEALVEAEQAFERRIGQVRDVIAEFDQDGNLTYVSPNVESVIGIARDDRTFDFARVLHPEDRDRVEREFNLMGRKDGPKRIDDFRYTDAGGALRWAEVSVSRKWGAEGLERTIAVGRDVTERRRHQEERERLDRQLESTQRLEVVGVMAGGIAHDFNNLLHPILGYAELVSAELGDRPELQADVDAIRAAAEKGADLIRQLLTYTGTVAAPNSVIDIGQETESLVELAKTSLSPNVRLDVALDEGARVFGDVSQLRQVIMNLILNAGEAIGNVEGTVSVTVRSSVDTIELTVADDGCGMDDETRERAFEPFFTTKFAGRGLGLSSVMGIVRAHDGHLSLQSESGRGTTVKMVLSAVVENAESRVDTVECRHRFRGEVLLVDDEAMLRKVGKSVLQGMGYQVVLATDGAEALVKFEEGRFAAIILDLVMPRVDGRQVLREVRRLAPRQPVLVVSGYGAALAEAEFPTDAYTRFLGKPFRSKELGEELSELIPESIDVSRPGYGHSEPTRSTGAARFRAAPEP